MTRIASHAERAFGLLLVTSLLAACGDDGSTTRAASTTDHGGETSSGGATTATTSAGGATTDGATTSAGGSSSSSTGGGSTGLPTDCAAAENKDSSICTVAEPAGATIGSGPAIDARFGHVAFGFVADDQVIIAVHRGLGESYVMRISLATGDRTVLSGTYEDPVNGEATIGTGPAMRPYDVAPSGAMLAVFDDDRRVFLVSPDTGERTLAYDFENDLICEFGGLNLTPVFPSGLESDDAGAIILHTAAQGYYALARLDGGDCEIVSASEIDPPTGTGPDLAGIQTLSTSGTEAFAVSYADASVFHIDLTTGDRTRVSSSSPAHMVGTGPETGFDSSQRAENGDLWVGGYSDSDPELLLTEVSLPGGKRTAHHATSGPLLQTNPNQDVYLYGQYQGFWVIGASGSIYLYDPVTHDSNRISR